MMTENRLIGMKGIRPLFLLFISGYYSFALGSSDFHLINMAKTYTEAKTYCREMYTDLATVHNSTDMDDLVAIVPSGINRAWIGLETGAVRMWHWSWPDQELDFFNWKAGEPQINNEDACAAMDQRGEWVASECGTRRSFVCHGNSDTSGLVYIAEAKSWRDAQDHCRASGSSDLVSIHSAEENEAVHNVSVSQKVWIGLFKDPWKWSDGSETSFRYWKRSQPNYLAGQDCAAAIFRDRGRWNDLKCVGRRNFVCRGAKRSIPTTTSQTSTQETTANVTTLPTTPTQEVNVTHHFTVATTNQSHTTVTTEAATTADEPTTQNTTDLVSSTSSTALNNATEMPNVTQTQPPPPTATVNTDNVSTSAQTTQPSTLKPTENSVTTVVIHKDNLILIQDNMTWMEAMGYCREHHVDLVHISNGDVQRTVAEIAKSATSPHVWLGLRYTCRFNFWFWVKSTAGCYQNWAPGQGSEGVYDCDVTGAIEATGRQQWVGLPETERLNFICYKCTG